MPYSNTGKVAVQKPENLALKVYEHFHDIGLQRPSKALLEEFFDCLFYASLEREEGQEIRVTVTYYNPRSQPARQDKEDGWSFVQLDKPIPLNVSSLVKLAKAADPWSGSVAVSHINQTLSIVGLIDQAVHLQSYLNLEEEARPEQPGLFQAFVTGIGSITVMRNLHVIASFKKGTLITDYLDVLSRKGQVFELITRIAENTAVKVARKMKENGLEAVPQPELVVSCRVLYIRSLKRILTRIKNYAHGGAMLITPGQTDLKRKYGITYDRITQTIIKIIYNKQLPPEEQTDMQALTRELKGAIRFVASQSCVDGLVLLDTSFVVKGFGVVIDTKDGPEKVYQSLNINFNPEKTAIIVPNHFGTRHRSMFSYCYYHPGSLGFVVSQDGDIRAITRVGTKIVIWENILIQKGKATPRKK
ncbi:putative sensor domain DACNV-containing protein [Chitinophaga nivalis]|uniref:Probable sensor domain-containing protein n=1 Tax=Chitinophaga nivalis TaxID=2991709 RepID=A0ABT3IKG3_9BACT|nr:hypothetical protein [Chitinophaga nivalis]MCW3465847.1 hypothetical protein [Chitinophaga nivalis]MCW3484462.1 hypothetical protein [Chitinophaga nivalis]